MNTSCKNCHFGDSASSEKSCEFNIIDSIKDTKEILVQDGYYYIKNYACRYGVSSEVYNEKIKDMNIDIRAYSIKRSEPKYFLCAIAEDTKDSISNICHDIKKLTIQPQAISIFTHKDYINSNKAKQNCEDILDNNFKWKLHIRLDDLSDEQKAIKNLISTDTRTGECGYIFFVKENMLNYIVENNSIAKIEYIINVLQSDNASVLCSKIDTGYFNGIFIRMDNFKNSTAIFQKNISDIINENYKEFVSFYD